MTVAGGRDSSPAYRPDIDGLRAVAVLGVIACHAFPQHVPGGFVGVDVFFVISGFLISGIILRRLDQGDFTFREFFARRIARIFPALAVVLAATLAFGWFTMRLTEFRQLGTHAAASGTFFANFVFWREAGYFDRSAELKPLLHLWSLGVEEQFYLVWPPLLYIAAKRGMRILGVIAVVVGASFLINVVTTPRHQTFAFFLPFARLWELALGALLAHWSMTRRAPVTDVDAKSTVGLAMILAAFVAVPHDAFPGWWVLLPVMGAALIIAAGPDGWVNRWLMRRRELVFVGLISYPLYLWHWPVLSFARQSNPRPLGTMMTLGLVAASGALAWLTYVMLEHPIRFGRLATAPWRTRALASAMIVVTACGVVAATGAASARLHSRFEFLSGYEYDIKKAYRGEVCHLSRYHTTVDFAADCVDSNFGDPSVTSILLWGDSHAAHLYPGLRALADTMNLAVAQFTVDACEPVVDAESPGGWASGYCARMSRFALDRVTALEPDVVLLASRWLETFPDKIRRTIDALEERGVPRIIIVGPVPRWTRALPDVLIQHMRENPLAPMPRHMRFGLTAEPAATEARLIAAIGAAKVRYVSALAVFCIAGECLTTAEGEPTAWDGAHLTTPASRLLIHAALADSGR